MYLQVRPGQTSCGSNPIQGVAPASGDVSACPDRVHRFIVANARRDVLTNTINGEFPSPNRFLRTSLLPGPANPMDNNQFFVWSQYVDFLLREPDSGGFSTWTGNLNSCSPSDWPCLNAQRIHTVRGFIESGEFKQGKPALSNPTSIQEYNSEYVRQLYLCLLRRQPDAGGFSNWLTFLNSTGDYSHVVHGFINSTDIAAGSARNEANSAERFPGYNRNRVRCCRRTIHRKMKKKLASTAILNRLSAPSNP